MCCGPDTNGGREAGGGDGAQVREITVARGCTPKPESSYGWGCYSGLPLGIASREIETRVYK